MRNLCQPRTAVTVLDADDDASGRAPSDPVRRTSRKPATSLRLTSCGAEMPALLR
ncbi:hypothetical protein HMPREF9057_02557 [Actinomyces sp. oral taxon 171 str. F0337]|nr:hypothetical protein HMPREF9057_02557 [Actinomyces sp. oral taxon 171 str. F0337]